MRRQSVLVSAVLCLAFCVSFVAPVHADPLSITILSGEQRVRGGAYEYWRHGVLEDGVFVDVTIEYYDSYDSGVQPWNGSRLYDEVLLPGWGTYASSYVDALNVGVGTNSNWVGSNAGATAEGTWVFRANGCELPMYATGRLWSHDPMTVKLEDLTSGTELFYYSGNNLIDSLLGDSWVYEAPVFSVDPGHVYRMYIRLSSSAMMDGSFSGSLGASVTLTPIPLPGAALLGVIGLGYAGMRLRRV